jgi:hypothetical protein
MMILEVHCYVGYGESTPPVPTVRLVAVLRSLKILQKICIFWWFEMLMISGMSFLCI